MKDPIRFIGLVMLCLGAVVILLAQAPTVIQPTDQLPTSRTTINNNFSGLYNHTPGALSTFSCGSGNKGSLAAITDSTTNVWGAIVSGGGTMYPLILAWCNGANFTVIGK